MDLWRMLGTVASVALKLIFYPVMKINIDRLCSPLIYPSTVSCLSRISELILRNAETLDIQVMCVKGVL